MRDIREKNWFWIENILIDRDDLNAYEKLLYMTLARYADSRGKAFPGLDLLMKNTGIGSKRTLTKHLKGLEVKGLVTIIKNNGKGNTYYLNNADIVSQEEPGADLPLASEITSVKNATTPGADLPLHQVQICHPKKTHLKKQNKKTHLEKINKKEKSKNEIDNFINSQDKSEEYKNLLFEFVKYRKKIKKRLKTTKPIENIIRNFCNAEKLSEALEIMQEKEWQSIEPEWIENYKKTKAGGNNADTQGNYRKKGTDSYKPDYTKPW